jgi:hypothetical protein
MCPAATWSSFAHCPTGSTSLCSFRSIDETRSTRFAAGDESRGPPAAFKAYTDASAGPALISGSIAIVLNTLALPLATAKGGLLRLLQGWLAVPLTELGIAAEWSRIGVPSVDSDVFQIGFHLAVGLVMALVYAYALEPALPGGDAQKGALYAIVVWLLNAFIVLPATGEGFAGCAHLTLAGITWFAAAHALFFMALAMTYAALRRNYRTPLAPAPRQSSCGEMMASPGASASEQAIAARRGVGMLPPSCANRAGERTEPCGDASL